jgi:hypothetical protein
MRCVANGLRYHEHELLLGLGMTKKRKKNPKRKMPAALKRYWAARNKRLRNPKRRHRNPVMTQHVLLAQRPGGPVLKYTGGVKFSRTGHAVRFASKQSAAACGALLRRQFPVLKSYRVWAT